MGLKGEITLNASDMSIQEFDKQRSIHLDRFQRLGELNDIEKAIEYATQALDSTEEGDPKLAGRHGGLAVCYDRRFRRLGMLDDLERAIKHGSRAVTLTAHGDPSLPVLLGNLGSSYNSRFQRLEDTNDIETAIEHHSHALELTPDGHPHLSYRHASLGVSYTDRFVRLGGKHDIERAIEHYLRALELTAEGHPDLALWHANLGVSYTHRFRSLGDMDDLEKTIEHYSRALELTPDGHPDSQSRHANLGVSYIDRFRRLGDIQDLGKAIQQFSLALEQTPDGHPELSHRHSSLGVTYTERFERMSRLNDIEKGIEHNTSALELTPDDHPELYRRHANLGVSYADRFRRLRELPDLEKAIEHHSSALKLTPDGHPELPRRHSSLGVAYTDRFNRLGMVQDLEKAIKHDSLALRLTPEGHPDLPDRRFNQALDFLIQYQHSHCRSHLKRARYFFRKASDISTGSPRQMFHHALQWAKHAARYSSLNCIEAYHTTINLLPQFIWLGATTTQRYQDLSTVGSLAINAAHAAILDSDPIQALEWLEHARCVVWNQTLMLRTPLSQLQISHPDLAFRLQTVSKELQEAGTQQSIAQPLAPDSMIFEQIGQNRRRLAREYGDLLTEARTLPGFEDFLQPLKAAQLFHAARYGPIVVINCHQDRCDAFVILPRHGGMKHLPLPNFTAKEAQSARSNLEASLRQKGLRARGLRVKQQLRQKDMTESVLLTLWTHIVHPTLKFLKFINDTPSDRLPHITWCPTGPLSFLPLHAAGDYSQPRARVFDHVVSSYIPTLSPLLASTSTSSNSTPRLLAVSQTNTPGCSPLPGTAKELAYVKSHAQYNAEYSQLDGSEATISRVLDEMGKHDWVHLACHAHQNVEDPNNSGFFLHDGNLDLASINQQSFRNKGLAFLSACQTATGDEKLPDEAVHLASGMLMAGYTSVIATMWSVVDEDAPLVADKVYARLLKDGRLGNGEAGRALHNAVGELREKVGEKAFSRWVPYIHIGS